MKPDWKCTTQTFGGSIKDIPKPHVRKFPHRGLKRRVDVHIDSFVGVCGGARHWIPRVEVEKNPLWNPKGSADGKGTWQAAYDDTEGYGTDIRGPRLLSEKAAKEWVQWTLRAFDPKKHTFHYATRADPPKWFYAREGD